MTDTLPIVLDRIRGYWASRRTCGLVASAMGLRVARLIALVEEGSLDAATALSLALEAEAVTLCVAPIALPRGL
ncbi:hypothetical protein MKK68_19540 [Methylobacterium sp. E-016]|jgi:uncharacterized membrane protein|uniref:hypothetical protein n=1 Tax=Methylobacterium sp. E-016 TaxID=2836556 RepID=UPI001FB8BD82|nr:hypothetical protein [Methylobacterium sp. E-016]MCJ2077810.1 hypothetical protein [Methylobacterium sp. E-016]